jgi:hypothetical protein
VFHVLDPAELNFEFESPALFRDIESGRDMYIDPLTARENYKQMLQQHLATASATCRKLGIDYHLFATDRSFDLALLDFLHDRMHRRKQVRRAGGPRVRSTA